MKSPETRRENPFIFPLTQQSLMVEGMMIFND